MKKSILLLIAAQMLFATALFAADAKPNKLTKKEREAGWKLLFNGKNMNQWRNYKQDAVSDGWKVEDGTIVWQKKGAGDIITKKKFGSFEFSVDYKISEGGNSGLMFHVTEEENRPWQTGPEIQIQDNVKGHDPQLAGWLYQFYKADKDATKPAGEWNTLRILITPEKCVHWMNGVKYVEYVKGSEDWNAKLAASKFSKYPKFGVAKSGHLCLQDHNNEVAFRNIKVREVK